MDKLFEQIAKILPPPFLVGLLALGITFFATYYARGYRAYGDVLQDGFLRNAAVVICAATVLFWMNADRMTPPESNPVVLIPFFDNDEHDQYRTALSAQIEERLNTAFRKNGTVFKLPSFLNDNATAKQIAEKFHASAVLYEASVIDGKDTRMSCFKLLQIEPELYKQYSLVPMSVPQVQLDDIITTLRGSQSTPTTDAVATNALLGKIQSLQSQVDLLQAELHDVRTKTTEGEHGSTAAAVAPALGERRALIIAADSIPGGELPVLAFARSDAEHLNATLTQLGYKSALLSGNLATRSGVLEAIAKEKAGLTKHDLLVVYYTGHTTVAKLGGSEVLQLLLSDFRANSPATAVSINDFVESIASDNNSQVVLIIDGCFGVSGLDHAVLQKIGDRESFTILAGSGNTEVGFTTDALGGSVFTNILIRAIKDLSADGTSPILLSDLFKHVSSMMQAETQRMGMAQTPQLLSSSIKGDVVLVEAQTHAQSALMEQH